MPVPPRRSGVALVAALAAACATSPLGRSQLLLFPEGDMAQMGVAAYEQTKAQTPISNDATQQRYVRCVADAITREASGPAVPERWEVTVFQQDVANAFALPGGKIGVYTGLLAVAKNQDQLATVIGHEVAHVVAQHG